MNDKYHTRKGYEQLLQNIQKQTGQPKCRVKELGDYDLLMSINRRLIYYGCTPFTENELDNIELE